MPRMETIIIIINNNKCQCFTLPCLRLCCSTEKYWFFFLWAERCLTEDHVRFIGVEESSVFSCPTAIGYLEFNICCTKVQSIVGNVSHATNKAKHFALKEEINSKVYGAINDDESSRPKRSRRTNLQVSGRLGGASRIESSDEVGGHDLDARRGAGRSSAEIFFVVYFDESVLVHARESDLRRRALNASNNSDDRAFKEFKFDLNVDRLHHRSPKFFNSRPRCRLPKSRQAESKINQIYKNVAN